MMKKLFFFILIIGFQQLSAQYKIDDGSELLSLQKVPMEKIYVHASSSLIFSGEYLYYKIYCFNAQTSRSSSISSMAYVSLVNSDGLPVFEHKIRLEKGMGQGEHFLNTDIPSGNYKLIAYTQWMKNGGLEQIFQDDLAIVNPYLVEQSSILRDRGEVSDPDVDDDKSEMPVPKDIGSGNAFLQLQLDTTIFNSRQKAVLTLRNYKENLGFGQYSIAIKKREDLAIGPGMSAEAFSAKYFSVEKTLPQTIGDSIFLPEQRGELLFGKVINKANGLPAPDKQVVISIPGREFILKAATTDPDGYFFTYLRKEYRTPQTIIQVLDKGAYDIVLGKQRKLPYHKLRFGNFTISETDAEFIKERSVHNQVENVYFPVKPDSVLQPDPIDPFDGGIPEVFNLDDYTRFPTLQETLIEILNTVGYRKGENGSDYIRVAQDFETFDEPYNDYPAIVLVDGVFIPDHEKIKELKAEAIQTIRVLRDQLVLGANQYQGIVSIETIGGDYSKTYEGNNLLSSPLELPKPVKNYFRQNHEVSNDRYKRVPDYRYLLLWEPNINLNGSEVKFEFFTSDVKGYFDIILEGFTTYGKPVSLRKEILIR